MKAEEIKFKGIRVDNGEWVYGDLVHYFFIKIGKRTDYVSIGIDLDFYDVIPETVCQFTGLKDKNGVEIYEGDVFHLGDKNITYTVVWHDTGLIGKQNGTSSYVGLEHWKGLIGIIGNIHDKAQQKQSLIDMMRGDEQIGLYDDNPKNHGYER